MVASSPPLITPTVSAVAVAVAAAAVRPTALPSTVAVGGAGAGADDIGDDARSTAGPLFLVYLVLCFAIYAARVGRGVRPRSRPVLPLSGRGLAGWGGVGRGGGEGHTMRCLGCFVAPGL